MRSLAFRCGLVLVFLRFSFLSETVAYLTGKNTYLLYVFGIPALLGFFACGGLRRTFRFAPAKFWVGYIAWMVLSVPFSSWKGGSFAVVETYLRTNFIMLLVTAGLAVTWAECRGLISAVGLAAIVNIATTRLFMAQTVDSARLVVAFKGMITDPNDLAAHLLLVLPFLAFIVLRPRTNPILRLVLGAAGVYGVYLILRSGSRGGLIGLIFILLFLLVFGPGRQRVAIGIGATVVIITLVSFLPASTRDRLKSVYNAADASEAAKASTESREYLLRESIEFTFEHPLFGVGAGQFASYEGNEAVAAGEHGNWHETHNTYTQVSSECGIPALVFFLGAIGSTFFILQRIRRKAMRLRYAEVVTAGSCVVIGLAGYTVASAFLSHAFMFQFPAVSGLVIAIGGWISQRQPPQTGADTSVGETVGQGDEIQVEQDSEVEQAVSQPMGSTGGRGQEDLDSSGFPVK
jgi:O-antigen ligase